MNEDKFLTIEVKLSPGTDMEYDTLVSAFTQLISTTSTNLRNDALYEAFQEAIDRRKKMGHYYKYEPPEGILEKYLENSNACPFCGSENIEGTIIDYLEAEIVCCSCGKSWLEIHKIEGILLDHDPELEETEDA